MLDLAYGKSEILAKKLQAFRKALKSPNYQVHEDLSLYVTENDIL
jgi:hypothetical protein